MTRFQLTVHAERLPTGLFRTPNPYAVVTITGGPREGTVIGRTETIERSTNPDWVKTMVFETTSAEFMPIKISIYDERTYEDNLLAEANFEATECYQNAGHMQWEKVGRTKIYVSVEESIKGNAKGTFTLHLRGLDIKNVEPGLLGLGRSDPFVEISKKNADHAAGYVRWNVVHRSKHINDHLNPMWDPVTFSLEELCYGDLSCPLKVSVLDHERDGKHRLIGEFETNIQTLIDRISERGNADRDRAFEIFKSNDLTKSYGLVVVVKADLQLDEDPSDALQQAQASVDA